MATTRGMMTRTLSDVQKEINKLHGPGSLVALSDTPPDTEKMSSGVMAIDQVLGGGFPLGKMVELYGAPSGGKSAIALMTVAEAQKTGKVVFLDAENALDPQKAENSGIDMDELLISQPGSAEKALELIEMCVQTSDVSAVILDSVAALSPEAEIQGDIGDSHVGLMGRLMSQGLRKINNSMQAADSGVVVIFINQVRDNIGMMGFGPKTTTPGGKALKFWCSTRLDIARIGSIKQGDNIIGQEVRVKVAKSRFSIPFQQTEFEINYTHGVANELTLLDEAIDSGFIKKSGAWFKDAKTDESLAQGRPNMHQYMIDNPDWTESLKDSLQPS